MVCLRLFVRFGMRARWVHALSSTRVVCAMPRCYTSASQSLIRNLAFFLRARAGIAEEADPGPLETQIIGSRGQRVWDVERWCVRQRLTLVHCH
jgi:hypothetical protein